MDKHLINYKITLNSSIEKTLKINLTISNTKDNFLKLYKGKINFIEFNCPVAFTEDNHYFYIETPTDYLEILYKVKINTPGKHGFYGHLSNNLISFAGEQILLLPFQVLTCDSRIASEYVDNIKINYNFSDNYNTSIVPFREIASEIPLSNCTSPNWSHIYELMKNSYTFGTFNIDEFTTSNSLLKIYVDNELTHVEKETLNEINKLFIYYTKLFDYKPHNLSIILLRNTEHGILGGCGRSIICSSFNKDNLRDWQLLSHRMFHSFMDTALPLSDFHTPPTLWITEGLATYYENMALESLSDSFKNKFNICANKEFKKLFDRYLYTVLKDPYNFSFPPMDEVNISSAGKIEFLHYTQAPLIIKLIEDTYSKNNEKDIILNNLLSLDISKDFSLQELFTKVLENNLDNFAMNYLFNNQILPMWYLNNDLSENEDEMVRNLNYFEYVLYTWMILEDYYYVQDTLSTYELCSLSNLADKNKISFNSPSIENQVKQYSPTIYSLLKQYALRARVCNVHYSDKYLRYKLLGDNANIKSWETFISQHVKH